MQEAVRFIPNIVRTEMNDALLKLIQEAKVKKAVFDLGAYKSPGLDGFKGIFFQKNWEVVKDDLCRAVEELFAKKMSLVF